MTKTIAITGASGFTGGAIARHFASAGWRVIGFGRRDLGNTLPDGIIYKQWDITSGAIQIDEPVDVIVHSAAKVDDFGAYDDFYHVNVIGTQNVLHSFRDAEQFIYVSTSSVYDPFASKYNLKEDAPYGTHYLNAYGKTKMLAEKLVRNADRSNTVILRPRAIYGVGDTTLLPRIANALKGQFLIGIGNGENAISLTYIENFVQAVELVTQQVFDTEIFNITDGETLTLREVYHTLIDLMNWQARPFFIPRLIASSVAHLLEIVYRLPIVTGQPTLTRYGVMQLSADYTLNIEKAREQLEYHPKFSYRDGFLATRAWMQQQVST